MSKPIPHIQVDAGSFLTVQAVGLFEDEEFEVFYLTGFANCNPKQMASSFMPYHEDGHPVRLGGVNNPLTLWRPGFYQFRPVGELNERADVLVSAPQPGVVQARVNNVGPA